MPEFVWRSSPFKPAEAKAISGTGTTSASVTFTTAEGIGSQCIRVNNDGPASVHVRWGTGTQTAVATDLMVPVDSPEIFIKGGATVVAAVGRTTDTFYVSVVSGEQ